MPDLPLPDFTFDPDAPGACIAGVRPYREVSYRLDAETVSGRLLVHNYGHGGAGITLSWGCAARVRDIVAAHLPATPHRTAAVLGAGVMGLTAATRLAELGFDVTIYAERMPGATTSAKAGGQWGASTVNYAGRREEFTAILRTAYTTFAQSIGKGFGVVERPNFHTMRSPGLEPVLDLVPGLIPEPVVHRRLPFPGPPRPGFEYRTLLVEPPIFLARLEADLRARGVPFERRTFTTPAQLSDLAQGVVVNCTGLGAKALWNDARMKPFTGQLAMLPAQPALRYLFGTRHGYLFPRSDRVVIGGTWEPVDDEEPDKARCAELVALMAAALGGAPTALPEWHLNHPKNAAMVAGTWGAQRCPQPSQTTY